MNIENNNVETNKNVNLYDSVMNHLQGYNSIYSYISSVYGTYLRNVANNNERHEEINEIIINDIVKDIFPSGSGFDSGTKFNWEKSIPEKLVFDTSFHHMNENGYYDGWTNHSVIITPSLSMGYEIRITGKNKNDIKDYIGECFSYVDCNWRDKVADIVCKANEI